MRERLASGLQNLGKTAIVVGPKAQAGTILYGLTYFAAALQAREGCGVCYQNPVGRGFILFGIAFVAE